MSIQRYRSIAGADRVEATWVDRQTAHADGQDQAPHDASVAEIQRWLEDSGLTDFAIETQHRPYAVVLRPSGVPQTAYAGDWVVKDSDGEFSAMKPWEFDELYRPES